MKDILNIEIAIELDKGKSISEVAKEFSVKTTFVRNIAKKTFFSNKRFIKTKKRSYSNEERLVLVERIENGELLDKIATEEGINENTLKRWCKVFNVMIPRRIEKISNDERNEIREFLKNHDWQEISKIYNITKDTIEELKNPPHSQLDTDTLSYLFELLREKPHTSVKTICRIMKEEGFSVMEVEADSYKKRLRKLSII